MEGPAGGPSPGPSTRCACHYRGTTIDGKEFDSSYKRGKPTEFAPNQVIAGWTEAMQLMKEGDKWELVIPSEIAYGDRQMGPDITPGAVPAHLRESPASSSPAARTRRSGAIPGEDPGAKFLGLAY